MKEPILIELTAREAITLLSVVTLSRHELRDFRPELASAEDKLSDAILKATERKSS